MNSTWKKIFELLELPPTGVPEAKFQDDMQPALVIPLPFLGVLDCNGNDAVSFLHNQLTSDVSHLAVGSVQRAAWCSHKGRMIASFVIVRAEADPARLVMLLSGDLSASVAERLKKYIMRSRVVLEDASERLLALGLMSGVRGKAEDILAKAGLPVPQTDFTAQFHRQATILRLSDRQYVLLASPDDIEPLFCRLKENGAVAGPGNSWLLAEIEAGIPWISAPLSEELVPQMADFDRIGGVSFHKGCYPGQEIVARAQYLGKVKRRLFRIAADDPILPGTPLFSAASSDPGHACGIVVNGARMADGGYVGLAVLQEGVAAADVRQQTLDGGPLTRITPAADWSPCA